ncbi:MAG: amidohydrolase family protein, partial [Bacteroidota bacterium]
VPLNFPEAYDVEDPYDALLVDLAKMKHWELAPTNAGRLLEAGVDICLTTHGLKKPNQFLNHLRKAVQHGLAKNAAIKALTHTPASLVGASEKLGSLESGKVASFFIADGDILEKGSQVMESWVQGEQLVIKKAGPDQPTGNYRLSVGRRSFNLEVKEKGSAFGMQIIVNDSTKVKVKSTLDGDRITLSFTPEGEEGMLRLSGTMGEESWTGRGQMANGTWTSWNASYQGPLEEDKKKQKKETQVDLTNLGPVVYPFSGYGREKVPTAKTYLIQNATVWTNEAEGILTETDVLVQNGKISAIGKDLGAKGAIVIDGTNMHLTAGIIDEHSHIAISRGVNEGTQSSSAEVRIGDVVNSEDVNIYRQLAGGVTTSQLLHGSANPIGGQSAIIKLRWGYTPEEMKFEGADGFIKFALGENVKQSNWGDKYNTRFPQTRMGVEQTFENYFTEAEKYAAKKKTGEPYRVDLDLEAIQEIIESKRFITCHSYQQSEINMLMKVAERHNFRVNTFTHILEGYKIADIMAEHGAGGSSFSDWWAYKFEVYEAIPYNGALMHNEGVVVAFNSDDAEMARRLNQEAAKAVLYGGVSEEEALKFVTLNPAKLLHIDDRVGSIKVGKDADIVLWTDNPLSIYAKADKTFIDGIKFYDREEDLKMRDQIREERARLVQKMLNEKSGGGATQKAKGRREMQYHCNDIHDEMGTLKTTRYYGQDRIYHRH